MRLASWEFDMLLSRISMMGLCSSGMGKSMKGTTHLHCGHAMRSVLWTGIAVGVMITFGLQAAWAWSQRQTWSHQLITVSK